MKPDRARELADFLTRVAPSLPEQDAHDARNWAHGLNLAAANADAKGGDV